MLEPHATLLGESSEGLRRFEQVSHLANALVSDHILNHLVLLRHNAVTLLGEEGVFSGQEPVMHPGCDMFDERQGRGFVV